MDEILPPIASPEVCSNCGSRGQNTVTDSRLTKDFQRPRTRRCTVCGATWGTHEYPDRLIENIHYLPIHLEEARRCLTLALDFLRTGKMEPDKS